jgi:hypothetical protein
MWVCLVSLVISPSSSFEVEVCWKLFSGWESIFACDIFFALFSVFGEIFSSFFVSRMTQKREFSREFRSPSPSSLSLSLCAQPLLPNKVSEIQQHHNCITTHGFTANLFLLLAIVSRLYFKPRTCTGDANLCPMIVQAATYLLLGDSKRRYFLCFSCNFGNSCENFKILSELLLQA